MTHSTARRILIVDDDLQVANLIARALKSQRILCDTVHSAAEAEELMERNAFDAMIADLRMPGKHGHRLIAETLEQPYPPVIIAITGLVEPLIVTDLMSRGVADIMIKPFDFNVFAAKVASILARAEEKAAAIGEDGPSIADQISQATNTLRSQLSGVTQTFEKAINDLELKKEQIEKGFVGSLRVLSNLVNQVSTSQSSHATRVEYMSVAIGKRVGLDKDKLRDLRIAALLHEIGLFGMPDSLRNVPPWLMTPEQHDTYDQYPIIGATLLSEVAGTERIVDFIESHGEHFDGSGFPHGKKGDEIDLGARIIRIADGCDTVMMHAGDQNPLETARDHSKEMAGKIYDPDLAKVAFPYIFKSHEDEQQAETVEIDAIDLRNGMVVAENVYDPRGRFLVRAGAELSNRMIPRLKKLLDKQSVLIRPVESQSKVAE